MHNSGVIVIYLPTKIAQFSALHPALYIYKYIYISLAAHGGIKKEKRKTKRERDLLTLDRPRMNRRGMAICTRVYPSSMLYI